MENLKTGNETGHGLVLMEKERPLLEKLPGDRWDHVFAGLYVILGILMWNCLCMENFARGLSMFSILYIITVLAYAGLKKFPITGEKIFWTLILLGISLPYGFYSVFDFGQTLMIFLVAAYWTLVITEGLLWKGQTSSWILLDSWNGLIALPILNFLCQIRLIFQTFSEKREEKKDWRMVLLGILISIPALLVIIPILAQADTEFRSLVDTILDALGEDFRILIWRGIVGILLGAFMFGTLYGGVYKRHVKEEECIRFHEESGRVFRFVPDIAVLTFGIIVSAVYVLFIGLQARYLFSAFFGILPEAYTYAQYARQGFFELCVIALLNASFLIAMNGCAKTPRRKNRGLLLENGILGALTLLLLTTAASKLGMYIVAYGFTVKRCISSIFLIWLFLVFILVLIYQKKNIPLVRWSVFAGAVFFTLLCVLPVEQIVEWIPYSPVA
ncbi:MAG TPA: DUF4173 domain-containing protein [Candidatus Blautia stercorigallinarum]|uniref:DUF4173 domain-containing protein n=1 Tax=Candidatus Blautia stercorigallinarum TaxID=2838501 RepID=A0A9D1PE48_9FIRM|nr:DUF4173 domain-containing protein [Candidatus Blautia stercorigallinarum]